MFREWLFVSDVIYIRTYRESEWTFIREENTVQLGHLAITWG